MRTAQRLGIKGQKKVRAFAQLYAAALRGLAASVIWIPPGHQGRHRHAEELAAANA